MMNFALQTRNCVSKTRNFVLRMVNSVERSFAILAYVVMVVIDGAVSSVLSSVMIRMGGTEQEINYKMKAAEMWMREQRIPKDQASKALEYFRLDYTTV